MHEPFTIEERYVTAVGASHLDARAFHGKGLELIMAAGVSGHEMGITFLRLAAEWHRVSGDLHAARRFVSPLWAQAEEEGSSLGVGPFAQPGPTRQMLFERNAAHDERERAKAARLTAVGKLPSLDRANELLHSWLRKPHRGRKAPVMKGKDQVESTVRAVLFTWLDPTCDSCAGTGKSGRYGAEQNPCRTCRGSGRRTVQELGRTPEQRACITVLLAEIDRKVAAAAQKIERRLHGR